MNKLKRELKWFFVAGTSAVCTDFTTYLLLIGTLDKSLAKTISFICGTLVAYFINKFITFKKKDKSLWEALAFCGLYLCTLVVNVCVNKMILSFWADAVIVAFLFATGTSMVLNFLGQKFLVFKV